MKTHFFPQSLVGVAVDETAGYGKMCVTDPQAATDNASIITLLSNNNTELTLVKTELQSCKAEMQAIKTLLQGTLNVSVI